MVRAQRPTSAEAGNTALVLADGTIEGFVGGDCAEHSVRAYALAAIASGEPVLLRILPFGDDPEGEEVAREDGAVTVQNPCLSGGAIEVFLEPVRAARRACWSRATRRSSRALLRIGAELGLDMVGVQGGDFEPRPGDLALVVAGHGRDELPALRRGLEAGLPYVGLVASRRRGDGVLGELRGDGVPGALLDRIDTPAGPRHRRAHAGRDRAVDPRQGRRGAPRAALAGAGHGGRPDLRHDGRRHGRHAIAASTTARRSTSAARAARTAFEQQHATAG